MTLLENDVADLQDEVEELETYVTLQDQRLINVEENVNDNENDINGNNIFTTRIRRMTVGYVFTGVCLTNFGGVPHLVEGGTPSQVRTGGQYLHAGLNGVLPPDQDWMRYSPPPSLPCQEKKQLHSGRYASCVHAGGLSCTVG